MQLFKTGRNIVISVMLISGLSVVSCDQNSSGKGNSGEAPADSVSFNENAEGYGTDSMNSRGMGMANARLAEFSFERYYPALYGFLAELPELRDKFAALAGKVFRADNIRTEEELLAIYAERDKLLDSELYNLLDKVNGFVDGTVNDKGVLSELNRLGIDVSSAEGMFTGVTQAPLLENKLQEVGSPALKAYTRFKNAEARTMSGEYPFMDMDSWLEMVLAGEDLMELRPNPYYAEVEESFHRALHNLTDIHMVYPSGSSRQEGEFSVLVGETHTEMYPFMTEDETLRKFGDSDVTSRYASVAAKIAENMSSMGADATNIYVIVTEWVDNEEMAQRRVFTHLSDGEDIPHHLQVRRGDGKDYYAIAYRFYEDADKAQEALDKILPEFPNATMIYASLEKGMLYQLGPSAD